MAKNDEISSTERLLNLIRSNSKKGLEYSSITPTQSFFKRIKSSFNNSFSFRKPITVGVDISYNDLKLVKISHSSYQKHELLDYSKVPFEPDITIDHPDFYRFLKTTLSRFCGHSKNIEIWANISSARVEMRHIRIPQVHQKQIANAVYWSFKKMTSFSEKDSTFDYEVLGNIQEGSAQKTEVMTYTAPTQQIKKIKALFSKSGFPLTGISIIPFAFQNLLRTHWVETDAKNVSSLYIGRDWSRIDIFSNGNLVLSRGIKAGIKTMTATMRGKIDENQTQVSSEMVNSDGVDTSGGIVKRTQIDTDKAQSIFLGLIHDSSPSAAQRAELEPEEKEIFKMILPALKRLVRQVELTFEHFSSNFENESVERLYISSGIRPHRHIVNYIGNELGIPKETFDPFADDSKFIGEVLIPESTLERDSFAPAIGMALSNNSLTPNFLFTYKDKKKVANINFINKIISASFIFFMVLCFGVFFYQGYTIRQKKEQAATLKLQLGSFASKVDQSTILKLVEQAKRNNETFQLYGRKYLGIAVLSEIAGLTPPNIRLINISAQLGAPPTDDKVEKPDKSIVPDKSMVIDGIILGDRIAMESILAGYLISLKNSPMFDQPVISKKSLGFFNNNQVLLFTAKLKLVSEQNGTS